MEKLICALVFGEANTRKRAEHIAKSYYKNCPLYGKCPGCPATIFYKPST